MTEFFEIQLKTGLIIAIGVILYVLFLSKDHSFQRNRYWLLAYLIVPWIVPILSMPNWVKNMFFNKEVKQNIALNIDQFTTTLPVRNIEPDITFDWNQVFLIVFLAVTLLFIVRFFTGIIALNRMRNNSYKDHYKGISLRILKNKDFHPFSFLRTIYVPGNLNQNNKCDLILEHEMTHCKQLHSIDIILVDIVLFLQWWNPFVWWLKKLITQNHEYYVDSIIYKRTKKPKEYQYLLLEVLSKNMRLQFVHNFNGSFIKKRIVMMNQNKSNQKYKSLKFLPILIFGACSLLAFTKPETTHNNTSNSVINKQEANINDQSNNDIIISASHNNVEVDKKNVMVFESTHTLNNEDENKINKIVYREKAVMVSKPHNYTLNKELTLKTQKKPTNNTTNIKIKSGFIQKNEPVIIINGKRSSTEMMDKLDKSTIHSINVIKNPNMLSSYIEEYGSDAKNGVIYITLNNKAEMDVKGVKNSDSNQLPESITKAINGKKPYLILNGKPITYKEFNNLDTNNIESISVLKDEVAIDKYGEKGKDGVIIVSTK